MSSTNVKKIFYLLIILLQPACRGGKPVHYQNIIPPDTTFYAKYLFKDTAGIVYYECEDFVTTALEGYTISKMNKEVSNILSCKKKTVTNPHDMSTTDTIYTYSNPNNKIQIYRTKQDDFVFTFDVTDSRLCLSSKICTGITKTAFARKFHITDNVASHVLIRNTEATAKFLFHFDDSTLKRINTYIYLD